MTNPGAFSDIAHSHPVIKYAKCRQPRCFNLWSEVIRKSDTERVDQVTADQRVVLRVDIVVDMARTALLEHGHQLLWLIEPADGLVEH